MGFRFRFSQENKSIVLPYFLSKKPSEDPWETQASQGDELLLRLLRHLGRLRGARVRGGDLGRGRWLGMIFIRHDSSEVTVRLL